jgi:hypothetical protein
MTHTRITTAKLTLRTCTGRKSSKQHCFTNLQYTDHGHRRYMKVKLAKPHPTDICKYCRKTRQQIEAEAGCCEI